MPTPQTESPPAGNAAAPGAIATWLLSDGRPGHEAQLRGLAQALARRRAIDLTWVDVSQDRVTWADLLRGRYPRLQEGSRPQLAVGAGHGSHRPLLALGRASGCTTCVLMRPSLPVRCFDAAIIPRHDRPQQRDRVLVTEGVLNPIVPSDNPDASRGLILLGGGSPHFRFPLPEVCQQVAALCRHFPHVHWTASTSRRSPLGTVESLRALGLANLQLVAHEDTPPGWVADSLGRCGQAWISEDSVSMVYEALSAGIATGLIELPGARRGRLQRGIAQLHSQSMLNRLDVVLAGAQPAPPPRVLQEADRAADWLLQRLPQAVNA